MKIRVLEVISRLIPAGAEYVVSYLATGFNRERFDTAVVSLYDAGQQGLDATVTEKGVPVWHLGKRRGFDPRMYPRLSRVINEFQPDVIHSHCYVLRYLLPIPHRVMVHTVHNLADAEVDVFGRWTHRYAYRHGVVPIAVGEAVAESFSRMYGFTPPTILNGIDVDRYWQPEARMAWRRKHGFRDDELLIVSAGRLTAQKNPVALADAVAAIPNVRLLFAGEGELRPLLEGRERVHLLGLRHDIPSVLAAADIFALASDWEGFPLAVIEAMAAGLPVVATDVGSVSEAVTHGRTGFLVAPRDHNLLVGALRTLTADAELRQRMGATARVCARSFGVSAMVNAYEDFFADLLIKQNKTLHAVTI